MIYCLRLNLILLLFMDTQRSNPLSSFSPSQIFIFGLVMGVLVLCTIGFFILLSMVLNGNTTLARGGVPSPSVADDEFLPTEPTEPTSITVRPVDEKKDHIRGNKNAKVTIVEYSDFECPYCKQFHNTMKELIQNNDDVRWVYRHLPLDGLHQQAREEALATECAAEQGKFWEMADVIFNTTPSNDGLDLTKWPEYAKTVGLNVNTFTSCLTSKKYASAVEEDEADAAAAGARGTPYSVILGPNGEIVPLSGAQPLANIEKALQPFLN